MTWFIEKLIKIVIIYIRVPTWFGPMRVSKNPIIPRKEGLYGLL